MLQENEKILLIIFSIMLLVPILMILLFVVFNNRKNKLIQAQIDAKRSFEKELAESQVEIREETLRNISWELHDNIGQLLTLAKIQVQNVDNKDAKIEESVEILGKALREVRALSKSINPESLKNMGLIEAVNNELDRFERMKFIKSDFQIKGIPLQLSEKDEIIIFRIIQEFFSNTLKHARATELKVKFTFNSNALEIYCKDNGVGFEESEDYKGIGLKNMKNRANLIGAKLKINSNKEIGTELIIKKNFTDEK